MTMLTCFKCPGWGWSFLSATVMRSFFFFFFENKRSGKCNLGQNAVELCSQDNQLVVKWPFLFWRYIHTGSWLKGHLIFIIHDSNIKRRAHDGWHLDESYLLNRRNIIILANALMNCDPQNQMQCKCSPKLISLQVDFKTVNCIKL